MNIKILFLYAFVTIKAKRKEYEMLDRNIKKLVQYGIDTKLISPCEKNYSINMLLDIFKKNDYQDVDITGESLHLEQILAALCDEAVSRGLIDNSITCRDLFDTRLMNCITPRPAQVIERFHKEYATSPEHATKFYYTFSQDTNYIRRDRIAKDLKWKVPSQYGEIDITINLSKPEKDPKAIAAAGNVPASSYPKCQLCMENEGYAGNLKHPARQNHRIIPIQISRSFFADSSYMLSFSVLCSCVCSRLISPSVSSWHKQDNTLMHQSPGHIQRRTPYNF